MSCTEQRKPSLFQDTTAFIDDTGLAIVVSSEKYYSGAAGDLDHLEKHFDLVGRRLQGSSQYCRDFGDIAFPDSISFSSRVECGVGYFLKNTDRAGEVTIRARAEKSRCGRDSSFFEYDLIIVSGVPTELVILGNGCWQGAGEAPPSHYHAVTLN